MASWDGDCKMLKFAIIKDEDAHGVFKIERDDLGDFRKLEFHITFDSAKKELVVRTRKDGRLYGFNYVITGPINSSNLMGGLKKEKSHAELRIDKAGKFNLSDRPK